MEIVIKDRIFSKKSIFFKLKIVVNNRNCCRRSKFLSKIQFFVTNRIFCQKSEFWLTILNSALIKSNEFPVELIRSKSSEREASSSLPKKIRLCIGFFAP